MRHREVTRLISGGLSPESYISLAFLLFLLNWLVGHKHLPLFRPGPAGLSHPAAHEVKC